MMMKMLYSVIWLISIKLIFSFPTTSKKVCDLELHSLNHHSSEVSPFSPLPIEYIYVINRESLKASQQLDIFHAIDCLLPNINDEKPLSYIIIISPHERTKPFAYSHQTYQDLKALLDGSWSYNESAALNVSTTTTMGICDAFRKAIESYYDSPNASHIARHRSVKNFILFNFDSIVGGKLPSFCQSFVERYVSSEGFSSFGFFLNIINFNSSSIISNTPINVQKDQRFYLGTQLHLDFSEHLDNISASYNDLQQFAQDMTEQSVNFTTAYLDLSLNSSMVHLDDFYFHNAGEVVEPSDIYKFTLGFVKTLAIIMLIFINLIMTFCSFAFAVALFVVVVENNEHIIRDLRFPPEERSQSVERLLAGLEPPNLPSIPMVENSMSLDTTQSILSTCYDFTSNEVSLASTQASSVTTLDEWSTQASE